MIQNPRPEYVLPKVGVLKVFVLLTMALAVGGCYAVTDETGFYVMQPSGYTYQFYLGVSGHNVDIAVKANDPLRKQLCQAVQNRGYKATEYFDLTIEANFRLGTYSISNIISTNVSMMYITSINRDFNNPDVISSAESARLTTEAGKLCRDIQNEASKLGLRNVNVDIGQWDYVRGVRVFYRGSDCDNLHLYSLSAGSGLSNEIVNDSVCPAIKVTG